jgi:hypothetical protein
MQGGPVMQLEECEKILSAWRDETGTASENVQKFFSWARPTCYGLIYHREKGTKLGKECLLFSATTLMNAWADAKDEIKDRETYERVYLALLTALQK